MIDHVKRKRKNLRSVWILFLVMVTALFITGTVFAEGDLPADSSEETAIEEQEDVVEEEISEPGDNDPGIIPAESEVDAEDPAGENDDTDTLEDMNESEDDEVAVEDGLDSQSDNDAVPSEEPAESETESTEDEIAEPASDETTDELDVEIVDDEGNPLDMDNPENIELASSGDPRWYYGGQWYSVVTAEGLCYEGTSVAAGTCWVSGTPITTALEKIDEGRLPSDGKLYVEEGEYNEGVLNINGTYTSQLRGLIGAGSGSTTIIGDINICVNSGFTLSGFTIEGGIEVTNSKGTLVFSDLDVTNDDGFGLYVDGFDGENAVPHPNPIKIDSVNFNNNYSNGAYINAKSTVTITNANFNDNGGVGLYVSTINKITLTGVTANNNIGTGIKVYDFNSLTASHIIANNNRFTHPEMPDGYGLEAISNMKAKILLENLITNENLMSGVFISTPGTVTIKIIEAKLNEESGMVIFSDSAVTIDSAVISENTNDGIAIYTGNRIKLSGIVSSNNGLKGLRVDALIIGYYDDVLEEWVITDYLYPSSVILTSLKTGGSVTANSFNTNGEEGLYIFAKGTITLSNLDSYDNGSHGLYINNYLYDEGSDLVLGRGNVTINVSIPNWYNGFWNNGGTGMYILSNGVVSIYNSSAYANPENGFYIDTTRAIKLNASSASGNGSCGAFLTNQAAAKGQSITIIDSTFDNNIDTGLVALSKGAINLSGSSSFDNMSPNSGGPIPIPSTILDFLFSSDGADNWGFYGSIGDQLDIILESTDFDAVVTIYNSAGTWSETDDDSYGGTDAHIYTGLPGDDWYRIEVTYNGSFEGQGNYTLSVNDGNHENYVFPGSGALLDNSAGAAGVTITTSRNNPENNFDGNANMGMNIKTNGSIMIRGMGADNNYRSGLVMDNPGSKGKVSFIDTSKVRTGTFNNNGWSGMYVRTKGTVNIVGIVSMGENGGAGLDIDNCLYDEGLGVCLGNGSVILKDINADGNGGGGVQAFSFSTINLNNISANNNNYIGINIQNQMPLSLASMVLKDITTNGNNQTGLLVYSNGNVTMSDINAQDNFKIWGYMNVGDAVHGFYNGDAGEDYWGFEADGGIELQFNLYETDNDEWRKEDFHGVLELFDAEENPIAFTFSSGGGSGLFYATWTPTESGFYYVKISEELERDGFYRFSINNGSFTDMAYDFVDGVCINAGRNISITGKDGNYINHNELSGLFIETLGSVKLQNVNADNNGAEGVYIDNYAEGLGYGSVTISGLNANNRSSFASNGWEGLVVTTNNVMNLNYINAWFNGLAGIDAWGESKMSAKNMFIMGNGESGMTLDCIGLIVLNNINAIGNGLNGIEMVNDDGVKISGQNNIMDNGEDGINIETSGLVNIIGVDARRNGQNGIYVNAFGDGSIILNKVYVSGSGENGIYLQANSTVNLTNVTSFNNGKGAEGDGVYIMTWTPENTSLLLKNAVFMGNEGNGLNVVAFGGDLKSLVMSSLTYFGNDTNDTGDENILFEIF